MTVKSSMPLAIMRLNAVWRSVWRVTSPVRMFARFTARLNTCATPLRTPQTRFVRLVPPRDNSTRQKRTSASWPIPAVLPTSQLTTVNGYFGLKTCVDSRSNVSSRASARRASDRPRPRWTAGFGRRKRPGPDARPRPSTRARCRRPQSNRAPSDGRWVRSRDGCETSSDDRQATRNASSRDDVAQERRGDRDWSNSSTSGNSRRRSRRLARHCRPGKALSDGASDRPSVQFATSRRSGGRASSRWFGSRTLDGRVRWCGSCHSSDAAVRTRYQPCFGLRATRGCRAI